jgi:aminopeptidase N
MCWPRSHCLADRSEEERDQAFAEFYEKWRDEALVIDKWFALQAISRLPDTIERVRGLMKHPAFTYSTPNRVYALIASFSSSNPVRFHAKDGSGYRFLADQVLHLDPPQSAGRLTSAYSLRAVAPAGRGAAEAHERELQRILAFPQLSKQSFEIATKAMAHSL